MLDFLIITLAILLVTVWLQSKPFQWKGAGIPYSTPLPIVGSMLVAFFIPFRTTFTRFYNKGRNSPAFGFHFFGDPALVLVDAELVKRVTTTDTDKFVNRGFHKEESYDPMAKGLFFSDGEQWKVFRSKMTPSFTPAKIKAMIPLINPSTDCFVNDIKKNAPKGPVDVYNASMKFAVDVVTTTIFGLEPDSFVNPDSFFFGLQRELVSFSFAIKTFIGNMCPFLYNLMGLTILSRPKTEELTVFVNDMIDQRLKGVGNRPDFVQSMVELLKKENANSQEVKLNADGTTPAKFDKFGVTGQCMLMYLAGTETTGNTIAFLLYELALNQEAQEKARKEIVSMVERTKGQYNFDDLHNLHYVHMVLKETLRKYPVAVAFSRKCDQTLDLKGITVEKGTMVFISPLALQHDPKYFPNPEKFIPERFEDESNIVPGSYVPFGMGPRTCIGMRFAQTEVALALCKLLPQFKLTPSKKTKIPIKFNYNPTLSPSGGLWLNVEPIK